MIDLLAILVRRRGLLLSVALGSALAAAGISLLLPQWYRATASILPPQRDASMPFLADLTARFDKPFSGYILEGRMGSLLFVDILKSRAVGEETIREQDLTRIYGCETMEECLEKLRARTYVKLRVDGVVEVSHEEQSPRLAAAVANTLVDALDRFNRELNTTRGRVTREFVESQLEIRRGLLTAAEDSLRRFRESNGAVELTEQMESVISLASQLKAREIALTMDRDLARRFETADSPKVRRLEAELEEVRERLEQVLHGRGARPTAPVDEDRAGTPGGVSPGGMTEAEGGTGTPDSLGPTSDILPPMSEVPRLMMQLGRLERKVEIHEKVLSLLMEQRERSRIEERKDTPTLNVIDHARPPVKRVRPKRGFFVAIVTGLMMAWTALAALFWERYLSGGLTAREQELVRGTLEALRGDLRSVLRRGRKRPPRSGEGK
jgi:tyrosine-protein kinase Etk/Wzc